jgi:hypothetical protein
VLNNQAATAETVEIEVLRYGSTARCVYMAVLAQYETVTIANIPLNGGDILKGVSTHATAVDYTVSLGVEGPLHVASYDANGALKQVNTGVSGSQSISAALAVGTTLTLTPGASTAAAGSTTSDATALPSGTAAVYPTTGADDTKGVRVAATDKVTGRMIFIGNGVSNKILKVYAPSGGTINGGSADAAFSSASGGSVIIYCLSGSGNTWLAWVG